jgi:hypothetical protein
VWLTGAVGVSGPWRELGVETERHKENLEAAGTWNRGPLPSQAQAQPRQRRDRDRTASATPAGNRSARPRTAGLAPHLLTGPSSLGQVADTLAVVFIGRAHLRGGRVPGVAGAAAGGPAPHPTCAGPWPVS